MDIRTAILKAADWIQWHPSEYQFGECKIPSDCGTPGCALGWIGFFGGCLKGDSIRKASKDFLGLTNSGEFYKRMYSVAGICFREPATCARALRLYADKYHPAAKTPDWEALAKPDARTMESSHGPIRPIWATGKTVASSYRRGQWSLWSAREKAGSTSR